jgi:transcriptional regulator with XRE-family HTH domain
MRTAGLTDQQLADRVGVSRSYVSRLRSGRRPWSSTFQEKVMAALEVWDRGTGAGGQE